MKPRLFICAKLKCLSPIAIGSGLSEFTDNDVLLSSEGKPYIPGASLAGVCRHYVESIGINATELFGICDRGLESDNESRIIFYDATLKGSYVKKFRDSVRIDDDGSAADGGKFDYEVIDFDKESSYFTFRIEVVDYSEEDQPVIDAFLSGIQTGEIRLGHKSNRGFGKITLTDPKKLLITSVNDLIGFDWSNVSSNFNISEEKPDSIYTAEATFKITSFVTVANNASERTKDDGNFINSEPQKNASGKAIIPGTSWAGVFRHHFSEILEAVNYSDISAFLETVFGSTEKASKIVFDETQIIGNSFMLQTRNAIDRFTGGACDAKLFTNELSFGGKLKLSVTLKAGLSNNEQKLAQSLIETTLSDLGEGTLNIGGLGSVGGGILERIGE